MLCLPGIDGYFEIRFPAAAASVYGGQLARVSNLKVATFEGSTLLELEVEVGGWQRSTKNKTLGRTEQGPGK